MAVQLTPLQERALKKYPVEDGPQPGVDRNGQARHAYAAGAEDATRRVLEALDGIRAALPHCDGPGDASDEVEALQRRLRRSLGEA